MSSTHVFDVGSFVRTAGVVVLVHGAFLLHVDHSGRVRGVVVLAAAVRSERRVRFFSGHGGPAAAARDGVGAVHRRNRLPGEAAAAAARSEGRRVVVAGSNRAHLTAAGPDRESAEVSSAGRNCSAD